MQMDTSSKGSTSTVLKLAAREQTARNQREAESTKTKKVNEAVEMVEAEVPVLATATRIVTTVEKKGTRRRITGRSIPIRYQSGSRKVRYTVAQWR